MCNYCGCRAFEPIANLSDEHVQILGLSGDIRRAVGRGEHMVAAGLLGSLQDVLELHDGVEELARYPAMARQLEYGELVGTLFDEHDEVDRVIQATLSAGEDSRGTEDWATVLVTLEMLAEHIDHEEHGVFPAAAVTLDPADWVRATAVRVKLAADARGRRSAD